MKQFDTIRFDPEQCAHEAEELRALLAANVSLTERKQILPFFKARKHLSAYLGSYHPGIVRYDLVAHELALFGDFTCDLVVGDSKSKAFAFIEFEDAAPESIFVKKGAKATPEWAPRFEKGFSQLVDWFFKLHEQGPTPTFETLFGSRSIQALGLLVVGRTEKLAPREVQRLRWREEHVLVNSKPIYCKTFDQLCEDLLDRLKQYPRAEQAEAPTAQKDSGRAAKGKKGK